MEYTTGYNEIVLKGGNVKIIGCFAKSFPKTHTALSIHDGKDDIFSEYLQPAEAVEFRTLAYRLGVPFIIIEDPLSVPYPDMKSTLSIEGANDLYGKDGKYILKIVFNANLNCYVLSVPMEEVLNLGKENSSRISFSSFNKRGKPQYDIDPNYIAHQIIRDFNERELKVRVNPLIPKIDDFYLKILLVRLIHILTSNYS